MRALGCQPLSATEIRFALDVMEPVRSYVDASVLDLLEGQVLTSCDFVELSNGVCRLRAPLTQDLSLTLSKWWLLMAPIVATSCRVVEHRSRALSPCYSRKAVVGLKSSRREVRM